MGSGVKIRKRYSAFPDQISFSLPALFLPIFLPSFGSKAIPQGESLFRGQAMGLEVILNLAVNSRPFSILRETHLRAVAVFEGRSGDPRTTNSAGMRRFSSMQSAGPLA